jgi:hypothetical protein
MAFFDECMSHADECVRLAGMTDDTIVRDQIVGLACGWISTALHAHKGGRACDRVSRGITLKARQARLVTSAFAGT